VKKIYDVSFRLEKKRFVVRIEAYEGDGSSIKLTSDSNDSLGEMYCVGQMWYGGPYRQRCHWESV
jgi:hypothetical protein